jgi:hypothetical protein
MEKMGGYCKAYPIHKLRGFDGWSEKSENARKETQQVDGRDVDAPRELSDKAFLYLQDNFTVTDGVFLDQNIIFDSVTAEWVDYCKNVLEFEIPEYQRRRAQAEALDGNATKSQADNATQPLPA